MDRNPYWRLAKASIFIQLSSHGLMVNSYGFRFRSCVCVRVCVRCVTYYYAIYV